MGVLECLEHRLLDLFLLDVLVNVPCFIAGAAMKQAFRILPLVSAMVLGSSLASEAHRGFVSLFCHSEVHDLILRELDKVSRCTPNLKSGTRSGCPGSHPGQSRSVVSPGDARGFPPNVLHRHVGVQVVPKEQQVGATDVLRCTTRSRVVAVGSYRKDLAMSLSSNRSKEKKGGAKGCRPPG